VLPTVPGLPVAPPAALGFFDPDSLPGDGRRTLPTTRCTGALSPPRDFQSWRSSPSGAGALPAPGPVGS